MASGSDAAFGGSAMPTVVGTEGQEVTNEINVVPMADVMLVLLIIFMVITPAMAGYVAILPKAVNVAPEKDDRVTLGIDNQGRYFLENEDAYRGAIPVERLEQALRDAYTRKSPDDHVLYLKSDHGVQYSVVLTAIDAARRAGVLRIGAITELPKSAAEAQ